MVKEERKEEHKPRIIKTIALIAGVATFLCGLLMVPFVVLAATEPNPGEFRTEGIMRLFFAVAFEIVSLFWPIAIIGLTLSMATLFIQRKNHFRILPFAFVLTGIGLYAVCFFILSLL